MNSEEIKEMLDYISSRTVDDILLPDYFEKIEDYITNLQEKYEEADNDRHKLFEQKEKATDKIQYIIDYGFDYDGFNTVESLKGLIDMLVDYARQSKDILNGGNYE